MSLKDKIPKSIPYVDLHSGWTFLSLPKEDVILGIKTVIIQAHKLENEDGTPVIDPNSGKKIYGVNTQQVVRIFSKEEHAEYMKLVDNLGLK